MMPDGRLLRVRMKRTTPMAKFKEHIERDHRANNPVDAGRPLRFVLEGAKGELVNTDTSASLGLDTGSVINVTFSA
jgi:hypothetical protein